MKLVNWAKDSIDLALENGNIAPILSNVDNRKPTLGVYIGPCTSEYFDF